MDIEFSISKDYVLDFKQLLTTVSEMVRLLQLKYQKDELQFIKSYWRKG